MDPAIRRCLEKHRLTLPGAGPDPLECITLAGTEELAALLRIPPREAMVFCLERDVWPLRFARNRGVFSAADQAKLLALRVAVIGCGGLGGHVILTLARLGVGELIVCDCDAFDESNLNRQILCREDRLGMNKAGAARRELALTASHAFVRAHECAATPDTLPAILDGAVAVADCLDNLKTRRQLEEAANAAGIPCIHGAVAGHEGFAMTCRPRPAGEASALSLLHGEAGIAPEHGAEAQAGVPAPTPAAVALLQVMLIIRELLGPPPEHGGAIPLLHLDLSIPGLETLQL